MSRKRKFFAATLLVLFAYPSLSEAATLTQMTELAGISQGDGVVRLSVFDGAAGWAGNTGSFGAFGDGTVLDYALFDNSSANRIYADGGLSRIAQPTYTDLSSGGINFIESWTTNDPGVGFANASNFDSDTMVRAREVDGTVDISGLDSGSFYLVYGTFVDANRVSVTLSGAGQTDLTLVAPDVEGGLGTGTIGNNTGVWVTEFSFTTDFGAFTTLTYNYTNDDDDASPGSRARFGAVVLDGVASVAAVPEPSSLGMLGIGMLFLSRRRRRV